MRASRSAATADARDFVCCHPAATPVTDQLTNTRKNLADTCQQSWLRWACEGLSPASQQRLLQQHQCPCNIYQRVPLPRALAAKYRGTHQEQLTRRVAAATDWMQQPDCTAIALPDSRYPALLREIDDPPPVLFVRGQPGALLRPSLAIVGARKAGPQRLLLARRFAHQVAQTGVGIVSGLARGIDAAAHRGALEAEGVTIAVLAHGLDQCYPTEHRELSRSILENGALVSEFPPGVAPLPYHFPQRNRIITGLCRGVLVVSAAQRSGSLISARLAMEQNREVMTLPGTPGDPMIRGCHELLRQGALLIDTPDDILSNMHYSPGALPPSAGDGANVGPGTAAEPASCNDAVTGATPVTTAAASPIEAQVLQYLSFDEIALDQLQQDCQIPVNQLTAALMTLELQGKILRSAGGRYVRC